MKIGRKNATMAALVKVSPKAGHFKRMYVYRQSEGGWICGGDSVEIAEGGVWFSPENVIAVLPLESGYSYNNIAEGTLVQYWGNQIGIVTKRLGARYEVTNTERGMVLIDWQSVHPVESEAK